MRRFFRRKPQYRQAVPIPVPAQREQPMVDAVLIGPGLIYPDMLPENVWGSNLRGILPKSQWNALRIPVCDSAGNRCEVCGQAGYDPPSGKPRRPDCHEVWRFEVRIDSAVQRLAGLIALCPD